MRGLSQKKKLKSFYSDFVGPADLAFVFGDQTGQMSHLLDQMSVKTICIQPFSKVFKHLSTQFSSESGVILVNEDVGAFPVEFYHNGIYEKHILPFSSNLTANETQEYVIITTLDELIDRFGLPTFCYVSGEGFEAELLKGLNRPVNTIAFTFYAYSSEKTTEILRRILFLGDYEFNWKKMEEPEFLSKHWLSAKELHQHLSGYGKKIYTGEIFARLKQHYDSI
jgi:FkbM family methyltransferase